MSGVIKRSFNVSLTVLRLLGLYPPKKQSRLYSCYGLILLLVCLVPDPLTSSLYFLKVEGSNIMDAGFNLFLLETMICFIPKLLPFILNNKKIRKCIYFVETSIQVTLNEKQRTMIEECVVVCRRNSTLFLCSCMVNATSWSFKPLFLEKRELPIDVWLPFDPQTNAATFYSVYIVIIIGVLYAGLVAAAVDPLISGLTYHITSQIIVLKDNLQHLSEYADEEILNMKSCEIVNEKTVLKSEVVYRRVKDCVKHHKDILSFVNELENCFSTVVFSQIAGSVIIICFCCLELSQLEIGSLNFGLMMIYLFAVLFQIFLYCFYGTTLYEESNTLTTAVYMGQWYEHDMKSKKALIVLMQKSNTSMVVYVGKLFELSLRTFTTILNRSYSLLAVLKNY